MSELKLPRLLAAAKEFNVGQDTIIDFLAKKGFPKDDLKPTAKLSEEQYYALQAEFQSDKVARNKADHVELPKGAGVDKAKKAEEAPVVEVKKAEAPKVAATEPKKVDAFAEIAKPAKEEPKPVKVEAPEVETPKVVNKIEVVIEIPKRYNL
jgi:translation initiation factor IF-2